MLKKTDNLSDIDFRVNLPAWLWLRLRYLARTTSRPMPLCAVLVIKSGLDALHVTDDPGQLAIYGPNNGHKEPRL